MDEVLLTTEQEEEARRMEDILLAKLRAEIRLIARAQAAKRTRDLLGENEFQLRDAGRSLMARVVETALAERKKGGTRAPASPVRNARKTRGSSDTAPADSPPSSDR